MPIIKQPTTTKTTPAVTTTARRSAILQADLLDRFAHLRRQREASKLAERIVRIVAGASDGVGAMALEIAVKALGANQAPADPTPAVDDNDVKPA